MTSISVQYKLFVIFTAKSAFEIRISTIQLMPEVALHR